MAIMSIPSEFTKLKVIHKDGRGDTNSETFNLNLSINDFQDSVTAAAFDSWARGFVNLTNDTYEDCTITEMRIIEKIANPD